MQLTKYLVIEFYGGIRVYYMEGSNLMVMDNVNILSPRKSLINPSTLRSREVHAHAQGRSTMYLEATTPEEAIVFYKILKGS